MQRKLIAVTLWCSACAAVEAAPAMAPARPFERAPLAEAKSPGPTRVAWYQRAFPTAASFLTKPIPAGMVPEIDRGDGAYVEARGAAGELLGYLRDISGPASAAAACACSPLNITLVFERNLTLRTLMAATPLEKSGHIPFTPAEIERLVAIAKAPADPLAALRQVDAVVDATTGATKSAYAPYVIPGGALTTQRVVVWAMQTRAVLEGAPVAWDGERLARIMEAPDPSARARALAELLAQAGSPTTAVAIFWAMVRSYYDGLAAGQGGDTVVEQRLVSAGPIVSNEHVLNGCYLFAGDRQRASLIERCLQAMPRELAGTLGFARLAVAMHAARGNWQEVLRAAKSAGTVDVRDDPYFYQRVVEALVALKRPGEACAQAKLVYAHHPLLPGARDALRSCGEIAATAALIDEETRRSLVASGRQGEPAPILEIEDDDARLVTLALAAPQKVTVVVFFSTWCPHCVVELPRIEAFWRLAQNTPRLKERVRVLGVRTGVERESEPYAAFRKRVPLSFPLFTDATMSLAFGKFARAHGTPAALPTLAVADAAGVVRYFLPSGDWRDTTLELQWAVDALLPEKAAVAR